MIQNLKALLTLRAWIKSKTLSLAGILGILAGIDLTTPIPIIRTVLDVMQNTFDISSETAVAWLVVVKSLADAILRAKTEWSVAERLAEADKAGTNLRLLVLVGFFSTLFAFYPQPGHAQPPTIPTQPPLTFELRLQWNAPTMNTDGSPLTDLAGYRVYYARDAAENWSDPLVLNVPTATQYVLTQNLLQPDTLYFFYLTACNAAGVCSNASNIASALTPSLTRPQPPNGVEVSIIFGADIPM